MMVEQSNENTCDLFELIKEGLTKQLIEQLKNRPDLINSVSEKSFTVFEALLDAGFTKAAAQVLALEAFDANQSGHNPLRAAIATGNIDLAYALLEKGSSPNYRPEGISSALLLCLENEYFELAEAMVKHGAEVNIRNDHGWTPLIWASMKGRFKAVEFLLNHGANLHACNNDGWNAVTGAYFKKRTNIVNLLLEKGAVFSEKYAEAALLSAYESGYLDVVEYLVKEMDTNPNVADEKDISLLAKAVTKGDWPTVKLLLEKNANPNVLDAKGLPLIAALALDGHDDLIKLFLKSGADMHLCSSQGVTAIFAASAHNQESTVGYLIEKGANVNAKAVGAWTPLMMAADKGYAGVVNLLVELGANTQLKNNDEATALKLARNHLKLGFGSESLDTDYTRIVKLLTLPGH